MEHEEERGVSEISLVAELVLPKHRAPVRFRYLAQKETVINSSI